MEESISYRQSHLHKGSDYDQGFTNNPHLAFMWDLERQTLARILQKYFPTLKPNILDFACGTGRVLSFLEGFANSSVGVDISDSMLKTAKEKGLQSELLQGDITKEKILGNRSFDLISTFRFFPNAEDQLRGEVIDKLSESLAPEGILVFNNHQNHTSLVRTIGRSIGRYKGKSMSQSEVEALVEGAGLHIIGCHPLGIFPFNNNWYLPSISFMKILEAGASKIPSSAYFAQNIIYVCKKKIGQKG